MGNMPLYLPVLTGVILGFCSVRKLTGGVFDMIAKGYASVLSWGVQIGVICYWGYATDGFGFAFICLLMFAGGVFCGSAVCKLMGLNFDKSDPYNIKEFSNCKEEEEIKNKNDSTSTGNPNTTGSEKNNKNMGSSNYFVKLWRGEYSIIFSYVVCCWLPCGIASVIIKNVRFSLSQLVMVVVIVNAYKIIALVGTWRATMLPNYKVGKDGCYANVVVARILVVIGFLWVFSDFITIVTM